MRKIYKCNAGACSFRFAADFCQAADTIYSLPDDDEDGDGEPTPFQVADARHSPARAARILMRHFGSDWWDNPDNPCLDGEEDQYIENLIESVDPED